MVLEGKKQKQKAKTRTAIESTNKHRYKDNFKEPSSLFFFFFEHILSLLFQEWPDQTPPLEKLFRDKPSLQIDFGGWCYRPPIEISFIVKGVLRTTPRNATFWVVLVMIGVMDCS